MQSSNAILAINSLDRYITYTQTKYSSFYAEWGFAGLTQLALRPEVAGYTLPIVGATITPGTPGIPTPNTVVAVGPGFVVIQNATTSSSGGLISEIVQSVVVSNGQQPTSNALEAQYFDSLPYSNNFTIQSPNALINGYIHKIVLSQIQLHYNIPTVCAGKNDRFYLKAFGDAGIIVNIPHGFYYPDELAAALETLIQAGGYTTVTVSFDARDGFTFDSPDIPISFPSYEEIAADIPNVSPDLIYRTYKLLGIKYYNAAPSNTQISYDFPNFLYTPYIDFYSDVLTNYQNIKDTNTSIPKPKGLIARVYLSGVGNPQTSGTVSSLGTAPFLMTADLNNAKVIRWSPDVAVPSIDLQLLDQYGELIPGATEGQSTEFQMTLLCIEGDT